MTLKKDELLLEELASAPATPSSGIWKAYFKSDGLYIIEDTGTEIGPFVLAKAETNANDIYRVDSPGGASLFVATINGTPSGTSVVYNAPSSGTESVLVPTSTSQLAKMVLYNTTRSNGALISNCNTGTNTITLTATVPANWANGDTITIASQTVSGGSLNWIDLQITSGPTGKNSLFLKLQFSGNAAANRMIVHPSETFSSSKNNLVQTQVASVPNDSLALVPINSNKLAIAWEGTPAFVTIREAGFIR